MIWSPLFDFTVAFIIWISAFGYPTQYQIEAVSFFLPPVLGALTVFPLYIWAKKIFNEKIALLSAALLSIMPGHIVYSLVSEMDHHVIEPILALILFNSFLGTLDYASNLQKDDRPFCCNFKYLLKTFLTGIIIVLTLFFWRGSTIFLGAIIIYTLFQLLLDIKNVRSCWPIYYTTVITFLTAAMLLTIFCVLDPWDISMQMSFNLISWFHPLLLVNYVLFFSVIIWFVSNGIIFRMRNFFISIILVIPLIFLLSPFLKNLLKGVSVIGGRDPWLKNISELRSMLFPESRLDILNPALELTWVYWLSPFILFLLVYKARKDKFENLYLNFFLIWIPYSLVIATLRERYVHIAACGVSVLLAYSFFWLTEKLVFQKRIYNLTLSIIFLLFMVSPVSIYLKELPSLSIEEWRKEDLFDSMKWLRTNTPKTSCFDNPIHKPEYGVLADWGIGSYIEYLGERPVVATNFGWETSGLIPSTKFITATSEELGNKIIEENMVRYIVIKEPISGLYNSAEIAGLNPLEYLIPKDTDHMLFGPKFAQSMFIRLYLWDGATTEWQGIAIPALEHYRLVYESPNFIRPGGLPFVTSIIKIFEYVPGAEVSGVAKGGESVTIEVLIETNRRRRFKYYNATKADKNGLFEITLPYSTIGTPYSARTVGPYLLKIGNKEVNINILEDDVLKGKRSRIFQKVYKLGLINLFGFHPEIPSSSRGKKHSPPCPLPP